MTSSFPIIPRVLAKTASYTVKKSDEGALVTTEGATGAITFTLPELSDLHAGWGCRFFNSEDQNMIVAAATADADKMIVFNDVAADSIAFQTASEKAGGAIEVVVNHDASKWIVIVSLGAETQTPTIVTA